MCPQDFAINKEVPFSFIENAPFILRIPVPSKCCAPKFEMLPTSLTKGVKLGPGEDDYILPILTNIQLVFRYFLTQNSPFGGCRSLDFASNITLSLGNRR